MSEQSFCLSPCQLLRKLLKGRHAEKAAGLTVKAAAKSSACAARAVANKKTQKHAFNHRHSYRATAGYIAYASYG